MIDQVAEFAAGSAGEGHSGDAEFFCGFETCNYVRGIAAGGDADGDVAGARVGFKLAGEDLVKAMIIGNRSDAGSVYSEGESWESGAVKGKAADQFGGNVLSVGGAATVAEEENFIFAF